MRGRTEIREKIFIQFALVTVFAAALGYAAAMDGRYQKVRRGIWLWAGIAALSLFCIRIMDGQGDFWRISKEILVFILLQFLFFTKMYGRADCFAFSCCAIFLGAFGGGIQVYLLHMLLSIGILGMVQLFRRNVDRHGNLKEPKAFIPYISVALLIMILCFLQNR